MTTNPVDEEAYDDDLSKEELEALWDYDGPFNLEEHEESLSLDFGHKIMVGGITVTGGTLFNRYRLSFPEGYDQHAHRTHGFKCFKALDFDTVREWGPHDWAHEEVDPCYGIYYGSGSPFILLHGENWVRYTEISASKSSILVMREPDGSTKTLYDQSLPVVFHNNRVFMPNEYHLVFAFQTLWNSWVKDPNLILPLRWENNRAYLECPADFSFVPTKVGNQTHSLAEYLLDIGKRVYDAQGVPYMVTDTAPYLHVL